MDLEVLNPWWEHKTAIENDKHLRNLRQFKYIHKSPHLDHDFKKNCVYTIRGPRQVGKTTFLKLFIEKKLRSVQKENIFYWSCDNLSKKEDLIDLLKDYADFCKIKNAKPEYILLDEITDISEWQKAIKFVIDNDITQEACYILTGSNAIDLKKGTERLPGRRGKDGQDFFLVPLSFRQYVQLLDPLWFEKHKQQKSDEIYYHSNTLKILFEKYLITGGIPLVINEYERHGQIPSYIHELYYSWILGDVLKEGKTEQTLKEVCRSLLLSYSTPVSWDSLAKRSSVKSHVTISSYIELLSNLFVVMGSYFYDVAQQKKNFNKNKKIYFIDPFILKIFSNRYSIEVKKEKIVEGIIGVEIKRRYGLDESYYTKFKQETDFIVPPKSGFEVKYQHTISSDDFVNKKYFDSFKIVSKQTSDTNVVPAYVFLFANS